MNGMRKPCKSAPENLNSKYLELTSHVADRFYQFDQFLVHSAFEDLPIIEYQFITAKESIMCPVDFSMHTDKPRGLSIRPVRDMDIKVSWRKPSLFPLCRQLKREYTRWWNKSKRQEGIRLSGLIVISLNSSVPEF